MAFARRWATASGLLTLLLAAGLLVAWVSEVPALVRFAGQLAETNACVCLSLVGLALLVLAPGERPWRRWSAAAFALLAAGAAGATVLQDVLAIDLGIDQLLARSAQPIAGTSFPNRMSPPAAVVFAQIAAALLLLPSRRRTLALAGQALALAAATISALALVGYLYREPVLYETVFIRLSPFTAFSLLAVALGAMALRPGIGIAAFISGPRTGSYMSRRLLAPVLVLPVLLGWATLELERRHIVSHTGGAVLNAMAIIVVLLAVLHRVVHSLDVLDAGRRASERDRALLFESERAARQQARAAAAELQAASDRLRATLDAAAIGTYTWDVQSGVARHDRGVQTIFGLAGDEQPGLDAYRERIHPDDREAWQEAVAASLADGRDLELRYRLLLPSGEIRWVLDKGRVSLDEAGRPGMLTGAIVDLTAEHEAREAAEAASRAKDEFLAMLGHELRNPLSPIVTSLELMRQRAPETLTRERAVVERQVQYMLRLVDDLLEVSRIARGRIELRRRQVELADVVAAAIEIVSPLLEERHHHLVCDVAPTALVVDGDPARLTQVLANILSNAAKYTDPGGRVHIAAERAGGQAVVRVSDTGVGIAPELLPVVFDLFVQGGRTIDRSQGGMGLGLAIVKSLVTLHGGSVSARSDGVGQGSEFVITLPLVAADAPAVRARGSVAPPPRPATQPRSILVVDDNQDAAELIAEALTAAGHQVRTAFDGPAALAISQEFDPDVVFLDIGLPVMDGYEVARRMRALEGKRMTLVAVTGYGQEADRKRALAAGFDSHLVKPVPIEVTLAIASSGHDSN